MNAVLENAVEQREAPRGAPGAVSSARPIEDFRMIEAGDRVMVCMSGGRIAYTMLDLLRSLSA